MTSIQPPRKFVVYLTMYTGTKLPKWYIGSSYEEKVLSGYNGTVLSTEYKEIYKLEQKENKHLFKTRILSYHETRECALDEELRLQKKHLVIKNSKYINMSYAKKNGYFGKSMKGVFVGEKNGMYGKTHTDSVKEEISKRMSGEAHMYHGIQRDSETKQKISDSLVNFYKNTPSASLNISKKAKERYESLSEEELVQYSTIRKIGMNKYYDSLSDDERETVRKNKSEKFSGDKNPFYGKAHPLDHECEYCGKLCAKNIYNRFHGENCKHKKETH